ncbi:hypothetical protein [Caulobacter mirabilis]|uniref:Uncharacterized protein n=1 Tax=Caulobacter mirabilis TaxID=69666 RepID=A0A2D2B347_9CAUL|nr:hypothetical protein [Caulobacter mirabilis]ATQ44667.1 hypothetical protein CSW64_20890 [Caulobacter mirabilis]
MGCAVLGLTLGFRDQIRRNPPAWYTGAREKPVIGGDLIQAKEATPFDPNAQKPALQVVEEEDPKPKAEEPKPAETAAAETTPAAGAEAVAAPKPKTPATPAPKSEPQSDDPVGDLLESQKKPPETPPVVPY